MATLTDDPRFQESTKRLLKKAQGGMRVLGGRPVPVGELPDCVAIGCSTEWLCTGTLIAPNVVLTAGHCAGCSDFVFFGNDTRGVRPGKKGAGSIVKVSDREVPPKFDGVRDDLMLLILDTRVKIPPRTLATTAQIDGARDGRVAGFGWVDPVGKRKHGDKRFADIPIVSHDCKGRVGKATDAARYGCFPRLEMVAKLEGRNRKDTCKGDSGGPLYVRAGKSLLLAAVTSRATGDRDETCGDGGIYVRVDRYKAWIEKAAGIRL